MFIIYIISPTEQLFLSPLLTFKSKQKQYQHSLIKEEICICNDNDYDNSDSYDDNDHDNRDSYDDNDHDNSDSHDNDHNSDSHDDNDHDNSVSYDDNDHDK